jgi:hypothetical protein
MAIEGADGVVDQNAGGASSDGGGNSGASDPQNSNGQQTAPKPAPGASPDKTEEYEKRFKGLTNDLQKERRARQDYERRVAKYETDLAAERQRVQALAGVTPQSSAEAENEAIRKRFNELYPHIGDLTKEDIEDFFEPARRKVTQQEVQRQRVVPSGKDRGIVTHGEKKIDVNDSKAVEDMLVKSFREKGGSFGRG